MRNWALIAPEKLDFKSINGPLLQFNSVDGWNVIGRRLVNGIEHLVLWANNESFSVTCSVFLSGYLDQIKEHEFGGPARFIYEIIDPGSPGQGEITMPSRGIPGFAYANLRREKSVSVAEMQRRVLASPSVFSSNNFTTKFTWDTKQTWLLIAKI